MKHVKVVYRNFYCSAEEPFKEKRMEFEYYLPHGKITKNLRSKLLELFKEEYASLVETELCEASYRVYYGSKVLSNVYFVWKWKPEEIYIRFDEYGVGRSEFLVAGDVDAWDGYCSDLIHYLNKRRGVKHD